MAEKVKRHVCIIEQPVESVEPDSRGDEQLTFETFKTVYASIEPLAGRELQYAQQMHGAVSHKIMMRYTSGITKRMRIRWRSRLFNLAPTLNLEETDVELTMYATEAV